MKFFRGETLFGEKQKRKYSGELDILEWTRGHDDDAAFMLPRLLPAGMLCIMIPPRKGHAGFSLHPRHLVLLFSTTAVFLQT